MARNIEIKARVADPVALQARVAAIATEGPTPIAQDDTFFHCEKGRLKLRAFSPERGELIFYQRSDTAGPKTSFYVRSPTADPDSLREALTLAHGQIGRVRKQRTLFMVGRTRVHLDEVASLGHYMELEVVMGDNEPLDQGVQEAEALMARLGIEPGALVEGAYLDLLTAQAHGEAGRHAR